MAARAYADTALKPPKRKVRIARARDIVLPDHIKSMDPIAVAFDENGGKDYVNVDWTYTDEERDV